MRDNRLFSSVQVPVVVSKADKDGSSDSSGPVKSAGRALYFYSDVDDDSALEFNMEIQKVAAALKRKSVDDDAPILDIQLHVQSYGGSVFSGLGIYNTIRHIIEKQNVPITTIVDGCAASAGTFLSVAGSHRTMYSKSYILIHQLSGRLWGTYEQMKDDAVNNDELMKSIKDIYVQHCKIPKTTLTKLLQHDLWFNAEKCLELGLVDEII